MKISVIIPAYNAAATIDETIKSVLGQTRPADEILVLDDGSTDETFARLSAFGPRIKVFQQSNQGAAFSRNFLCRQAAGDLVAFLDSDDVWHPDYLKTQHEMLSVHPNAAASFTSFLDSNQFAKTPWGLSDSDPMRTFEVMASVEFFESHIRSPSRFIPSACCILKNILDQMGDEPFPVKFRWAEDFWFMNLIPLFGRPVVYNRLSRVMYRLSPGSLSIDRLKTMDVTVRMCEMLARYYQAKANPELLRSSREMFPSTRRNFSKYLMGAGRFAEARVQIKASMRETRNLKSIAKSLGLLVVSHLPSGLQPKWPGQFRQHDSQGLIGSMKVSVVIPAYNSEATIRATLDSVLAQTSPADEILILDDGSTDGTMAILESYQPRITVMRQKNHGVARARNVLCARASGDLIAFIDHDDLWHPDYLRTQKKLFAEYPDAVAFFAAHVTLYGNGEYQFANLPPSDAKPEVIPPVKFIKRYHRMSGTFMSMSFCIIPKKFLEKLGAQPFCEEVSGVDDCHLFQCLPHFGPVVYNPAPLTVYRVTHTSQSADWLKCGKLLVRTMELVSDRRDGLADAKLRAAHRWAFAVHRRQYGKSLMSANRIGEARKQFLLAMTASWHPISVAKSLRLLFLSYLPRPVQPKWLPVRRADAI